jgi:glycine betaine/proline transport system ATP-binding protein
MDEGLTASEIQSRTGQVLGVHDCTLDVAEGEILVLMGLSGSGKSTLLRAVNGLNPVCRGAVRSCDGDTLVDVTHADAATLRASGSAGRDGVPAVRPPALAHGARERGPRPRTRGRAEGRTRGAGRAQLELVNLSQWADRAVADLSGGMQQRVGLARAFATEAPILLMDEPFSALDPLIRTRLQDELLDLQATLRRTIVFVSHDLDEAFKIGNRIAIMEGGRIVQCGTPREIFSAPASAYVADFVAEMNPLRVLCARDVMEPASGRPRTCGPPETEIRSVMERPPPRPPLGRRRGRPPRRPGRGTPSSRVSIRGAEGGSAPASLGRLPRSIWPRMKQGLHPCGNIPAGGTRAGGPARPAGETRALRRRRAVRSSWRACGVTAAA